MPTSGHGGAANLTKNLKGIDFPADKEELLRHVQQHHAGKAVVSEIRKMEDREYNSMADVVKAAASEEKESPKTSQK